MKEFTKIQFVHKTITRAGIVLTFTDKNTGDLVDKVYCTDVNHENAGCTAVFNLSDIDQSTITIIDYCPTFHDSVTEAFRDFIQSVPYSQLIDIIRSIPEIAFLHQCNKQVLLIAKEQPINLIEQFALITKNETKTIWKDSNKQLFIRDDYTKLLSPINKDQLYDLLIN